MGRTLQNTMVNLGLQNACDEAIYQVKSWGHQGPPEAEPFLTESWVSLFLRASPEKVVLFGLYKMKFDSLLLFLIP